MTRLTRLFALATTSTLLLAACGGGGSNRPAPIAHKFDDKHIVSVPMEKREDVFKAQDEFARAKGAHDTAVRDLEEARSMLQVAKNELAQAKLGEKSAKEKKRTAEASGDMNKVNPAMKEARVAELARRAADEKVDARKAKIKHLKKLELYYQEELYHKEARLEQVKARVARDNNINPKGFEYAKYEAQAQERSKRAQKAKALADKEQKKADEKHQKWQKAEEQVKGARGEGA